ncbi:AIPR family protein [Aeromonas dhakensis]|uniref:AIPR family protein n=1 Tax=Aeromonas dhakensis TaxID=196024 RepID=UPI001F612929|nr:AIPR family protein [Aeromonas dhakensis]UNU87019.1 abortive phage infection protein [Aeromonas dhakensis]
MNIILKSQVDEIINEFDISGHSESKNFEFFCNFCVTSKHYFGRFNPIDVTTNEDDASIDGVSIVIDGDLITTIDDAIALFNTHKTNLSVDIVMSQVKSGEKFEKDDIANFKIGIDDFLTLSPKLPNGKLNTESIEIIKVIFSNLKKVRNRRPNIHVYYCTSGTYKEEREIKACFTLIEETIKGLEYFNEITVTPLDRSKLLKLYTSLTQKTEAKLKLIDYIPLPEMPSVPQAYIATVNAHEYVTALLIDDEKNIRQSVFEENVRSFLGEDNDVNKEIAETLNSDEKRNLFSVLNNGVTIVAPELTLIANTKEITLTNYQIINGCQTSNTLYENKEKLTSSVNIIIKFIESPNNDISSDIISATNSQSDISKEAFLGLRNKAKLVQKFFEAKNKSHNADNQIYFERRLCEFKGQPIQATRIFDVKDTSRCYAAMFLNTPHNSARYVKSIFTQSKDQLFKSDDHESYYYAACLALYKYQTLINGRKISAHNYIKLRWHVIYVYKWLATNDMNIPMPNSNKAEKTAAKIIKTLVDDNKSYIKIFDNCQKIISSINEPTSDELKRSKYTSQLMEATSKFIEQEKAKQSKVTN